MTVKELVAKLGTMPEHAVVYLRFPDRDNLLLSVEHLASVQVSPVDQGDLYAYPEVAQLRFSGEGSTCAALLTH